LRVKSEGGRREGGEGRWRGVRGRRKREEEGGKREGRGKEERRKNEGRGRTIVYSTDRATQTLEIPNGSRVKSADILDPYVLLSLEDGSMVLYYATVQLGDVRLVDVPDKNFRFVCRNGEREEGERGRERGRRGDADILDPYVLLSLEDGSMVFVIRNGTTRRR
jgi:hypothetical protein